MSVITYIKERLVFIVINLIIALLLSLLMRGISVPINIIAIVLFIWFMPLITYMSLEFF